MKMKINSVLASALVFCTVAAPLSFAQDNTPLITTDKNIDRKFTDPVRGELQTTAAEKALIGQMDAVVASSKSKGALDSAAMGRVFTATYAAANQPVKPEVVGVMVKNLVTAFPDHAPHIAAASLAPANMMPSKEVLYQASNSAIMNSPRPFTMVKPVGDAVGKMFDPSRVVGMDNFHNYSLIRIASSCPDNPKNSVVYSDEANGTEKEHMGLAAKRSLDRAAGLSNLFLQNDVGINFFWHAPEDTSSPRGTVEQ